MSDKIKVIILTAFTYLFIQVICRIRPLNKKEESNNVECIEYNDNKTIKIKSDIKDGSYKEYKLDQLFKGKSS